MKNDIIYELPLNERIRLFLRLEQLFQQLDYFMLSSTVWDTRAAIDSLLSIQTIFSRNDVRSELLKELDRHIVLLSRIAKSQKVDQPKLSKTVSELENISRELHSSTGKIALILMECDLLKSISQRSSIPGGTCTFDLPLYHYWLQQDDELRKHDLSNWIQPFIPTQKAINLILRFIRESSAPSNELARMGFFQQTLDQSQPVQMVRVSLKRDQPYFVEISGGKHRYSVRFMQSSKCERPKQTNEDINFLLTRCVL